MKNKFPVFIPLFTVSILPLLTLALYPFGYSVSLISYKILSAVSAVICIASGYLLKNYTPDKADKIILSLLPLIQLINSVIYVSKSKSLITAVFMAVCFIMCAAISEKTVNSDKTKIFFVISSSLMFVAIILFSFVAVFFGNFAVNTVVNTVDSPSGEYYAEVVNSDQGATGGSTVVYVKKSDYLNLLIMKIEKTPDRIYLGEWGEYETMEIEWEDNSTLLINSKEYKVNT
ncbi:MAG: hypothetical protein IKJ41_11485 [Clostridia bacterium]|nr:hypothetical protein [Clostridia bacterium]